jgi:aspartyl-tRNA(Asn)/glutamyl-tRNA(Gln) amidotransferase subunit A
VNRTCRLRGRAWDRVDASVTAALDEAAAVLRANGVAVDDVTWWDDELVRAVGVIQQRAAARVHAPYFAEHAAEYGEDVRARVARALTLTEDDENDARTVVARARASWNAATFMYEIALAPSAGAEAPTAPVPATFRDETIPLVTPASGFGLPAAAVPIGFGPAGMPLGMQVIAAGGDIASSFALGTAFQKLTDWHERRPALATA